MGRLVIISLFFLIVTSASAQNVAILPFNAPTVVGVTSLKSESALSELASSFVQKGYALDFGSMNDVQFSTQPRDVVVADDLEFMVNVKHTVTLQPGNPLATVHIKTMWNYGELNKPVDVGPRELADHKRKYVPVYSNRIRLYIEAFVSEFDYTLLTHPLNAKP